MGQAIAVRTDYTAGEVRRFAQRAKDLWLGQERFTCRPRSTDPIDLSVWCGLS